MTRLLSVVLVLGLFASGAGAQTLAPPTDPLATPQTDVGDLIRRWRGKPQPAPSDDQPRRMRALAPVVGAKPSSGVILGVGGNVAFFTGDEAETRLSSIVTSATVTTRKQAGFSARSTIFGAGDRWRFETDHRLQWTSLDTYAPGMAASNSTSELARFDFYRLYQSGYMQVRRHLYLGGGLLFDSHTDIRPGENGEAAWPDSPFVTYSLANGLPLDTQISAGPNLEAIWDSRDNVINPSRGSTARASYRAMVAGFLGGDSRWDRVNLDLRTYRRVSAARRDTLAAWAYADLVVDGVAPYFDLPSTGSDTYGRSGRGYAEGRFRGEKLAFVELEYRGTLTDNGLLGWVAFANATTVSNRQADEHLFDRIAPGGGAGLRLLLNKRSKTNVAFDVGFGERGNRGIYLAIQEAF